MYNDIKEKSIKLRSVFQEATQSKIRSKIQKNKNKNYHQANHHLISFLFPLFFLK